jgi:cyclopropane-fatty-acyl-phospholipid synthase
MMLSDDLPTYFSDDLQIREHWRANGSHYQKTAEAWLANMDSRKAQLILLFVETYGKQSARKWWVRWRIFFMACAELWGYREGKAWIVSPYLLEHAKKSGSK